MTYRSAEPQRMLPHLVPDFFVPSSPVLLSMARNAACFGARDRDQERDECVGRDMKCGREEQSLDTDLCTCCMYDAGL